MFDLVIIVSYLAISLVIGLIAGRQTNTFRDFAIGKRQLPTIVLLAAISASLIEATETIDLAGEVISEGLLYCIAYLGAAFMPLTLAWFIVPRFSPFLGKSISTGDIMEKLFGKGAKTLIGVSTFLEMILLAGAQIVAISLAAQYFFNIPGNLAAVFISLITFIYFLRGGARSVNATDVFQFGIIIVAVPILCGFALMKVGGLSNIIGIIQEKGINFTATEPASYGECTAMFVVFALPGLFPLMIQRMLMAKNAAQLKRSLILNALIGTPFRIMIITLGLIAFMVIPKVNPDFALLEITNHLLPSGLKGFAIIGMLAILMSSIDSALHLGSVAFTQDLVCSVKGEPLDDSSKLSLARYASFAITIAAIIIAFNFESIGGLFYLLLAFGNSVIWPGLLLGITGANTSKKGFWVGAVAGFGTVALCVFVLNIFLLYVTLLAMATNILTHLFFVRFVEREKLEVYSLKWFKKLFLLISSRDYVNNLRLVKNKDYCNIFSICSIFLALYPFFILEEINTNSLFTKVFLILNSIIATISFLLLFVDIWNRRMAKHYPAIWALMVILALPTQTFLMLFHSEFNFIWILDLLAIIPLTAALTSKRTALILNILGLIIALSISLSLSGYSAHYASTFGYWAVLMHVLVLSLCLALFRKRDVEMCRFASATLLHETKRALSTFENAAYFYEEKLPYLVKKYDQNPTSKENNLSQRELDLILAIPDEIQSLSSRTREFLTRFFDRITSYSGERIFEKDCSVRECIEASFSDSSLDTGIKDKIFFEYDSELTIKGDREQLIQVFINILENASHALAHKPNPTINIKLIGQTVFITDNGSGISEADLPNIFDELFSTKSTSGQGLAFCKRAMIEHGGTILCTSEKDKFTRFELRFPPSN